MADWMDWIDGISGAAGGVARGVTQGAEPFAAWERVRSADLANDRSDVQMRDLYGAQDARETAPGYYANQAGAANTGFQLTSANNANNTFSAEQKLALQRYLGDPNDAFQQGVSQAGMTPDSPEYRNWLAEAMGQFDPQGAIKAQDSYGVPAIEQRNVNEQATLAMLEQLVKRKDPNASVVRTTDGRVFVLDGDGNPTAVSGNDLTKVAAMLAAKTPYDAQQQGLNDMQKLVTGNAQNQKTLSGLQNDTPAANTIKMVKGQIDQLRTERVSAASILNNLIQTAGRSNDPESFRDQIAAAQQNVDAIDARGQKLWDLQQYLTQRSISGGGGGGYMGPPSSMAPGPRGGTTVTTRPAPTDMARTAMGGSGGRVQRPSASVGPWDTGIRPIGGQLIGDQPMGPNLGDLFGSP